MVFENFVQNMDEAEKGLMHKLLNVPDADKISSKYSSGKNLFHHRMVQFWMMTSENQTGFVVHTFH